MTDVYYRCVSYCIIRILCFVDLHSCIIFCQYIQLGEKIFLICLLLFSTCFGQLRVHHQEKIPYLRDTWYLSLYTEDSLVCRAEFRPAYQTFIYTGCNRRNGPDFGRVFLMLNYTEKPQNTYIQS